MTISLIEPRERELAAIFPHQLLEPLQGHNLAQRDVHRLRPRLHAERLCRLVGQMGVQPNGCQRYRHECTSSCVYTSYIGYIYDSSGGAAVLKPCPDLSAGISTGISHHPCYPATLLLCPSS